MQATSVSTIDPVNDLVARLVRESEAEGGYTGSAKAARRCGSKNPSTFSRHCTRGVHVAGRRVVLESLVIGGRRVTTLAAIDRFLAAQQPNSHTHAPSVPPLPRSPAARRRASEVASVKADQLLA